MDADYVYDLTNTHFADYAEGSDLVVLGKLQGMGLTLIFCREKIERGQNHVRVF